MRCITDNKDIQTDVHRLQSRGIPVRFDTTDYLMHHKFIVVDREKVITGSYNWTRSGLLFNHILAIVRCVILVFYYFCTIKNLNFHIIVILMYHNKQSPTEVQGTRGNLASTLAES